MRVACPACSSAYDVPDALLRPGRMVRCARCGGEWVPFRAAPAEPPAPPPPSVPFAGVLSGVRSAAAEDDDPGHRFLPMPAMDRPERRRQTSRGVLALAWAASIILLLALGAGAYAWRAEMATLWPPSTRLYSAIGINAAPGSHGTNSARN